MYLEWPGITESGTVIIELAPDSFCLVKNELVLHGEPFTPKKELHVTLIGSDLGLIIQDKIQHDKTIEKLLEKTFEAIDWFYTETGPVHILSRLKEGVIEKSLILLIEMPGVKKYYDQLKALGLIDVETPVPPAHVTLYTQNCDSGIGVPDNDVLNILSMETLSLSTLRKHCDE